MCVCVWHKRNIKHVSILFGPNLLMPLYILIETVKLFLEKKNVKKSKKFVFFFLYMRTSSSIVCFQL